LPTVGRIKRTSCNNSIMLNEAFQRDARRLKRAVAPELPYIYLSDASNLDGVLARSTHCLGWQTNYNPLLRQFLVDRGEWCGVYPAVIIDVANVRELAADTTITAAVLLLQTFTHELTHALPFAVLPDSRRVPSAETLEQARVDHEKWATAIFNPVPWWQHGLEFTRRALHLHYRATVAGFDVPLDGLCAGPKYALAPPESYRDALGDEPARMAGATFTEILRTPLPIEFRELFRRDCAHYRTLHPPNKEALVA